MARNLNKSVKRKGDIAVKKILNIGSRQVRRNATEVYYLKQCDHPNVLRVWEVYRCIDTESIWITMELLQGGSLSEAPMPFKVRTEAATVCPFQFSHFQLLRPSTNRRTNAVASRSSFFRVLSIFTRKVGRIGISSLPT